MILDLAQGSRSGQQGPKREPAISQGAWLRLLVSPRRGEVSDEPNRLRSVLPAVEEIEAELASKEEPAVTKPAKKA